MKHINIIGAGLAGCEAALAASRLGAKVHLYDIKPKSYTPAHSYAGLAELVCSNSLKGTEGFSAASVLKHELKALGSVVMQAAEHTRVPAGGALAVDRTEFSDYITDRIHSDINITFVTDEVTEVLPGINIIATGPLTTEAFAQHIAQLTGEGQLYFYDAAAPVVAAEGIDYDSAYFMDRYNKGSGDGDYLNCPMTKQQYLEFYHALITAQRAPLKSFEEQKVFEGCMPVEVMAARGVDTLRFGPLKPVGLYRQQDQRPYAVVQLRRENLSGGYFNMVGFQTNLTFSEQKRVFSMIPALKEAKFVKYGVMHRNTYINSPKVLTRFFNLKYNPNIFFAGQISGVEGYTESAASGLMCGINAARMSSGLPPVMPGTDTMIGALANYITLESHNFQPMSANYAIIKAAEQRFTDKKQRNIYYAERSQAQIKELAHTVFANDKNGT